MLELRGIWFSVAVVFTIGLAAPAGCTCNETTEFPPGLEPLEENTAPLPEPNGDDMYPEEFNAIYGENLDWYWGHGRGFIHAPASVVWEAVKDPEVVGDRRTATELTWDFDNEPEYEYSYLLHYYVDEFLDVEWDEAWRYGVSEGTNEAPLVGLSRSQKVWGTAFIELVETSIIIVDIDENVTQFEVIEHLDAISSGPETIQQWFEDMWASILARVNGEPLPDWSE